MTTSPQDGGPRKPWLAVLAVLTLLTLALSWPLIAHLSSRLPGTATWAFDESTFVWNLWYFKHSLLDLHISPLHSELIWYPLGIDLILYTYNFFNALIALPLQVAFNLPLASNVSLLLSTLLSGFGASLLAYYALRTAYCDLDQRSQADRNKQSAVRSTQYAVRSTQYIRLAALLAGFIYAFASNRAVYMALGHYNFATTQWMPFYALYLLRTLRRSGLKNALLAGFFAALAVLSEITFAVFLALFTVIVVLVWWWGLAARSRRPAARGRALGRVALAGLVALLIWAPVLVPIVREFVRWRLCRARLGRKPEAERRPGWAGDADRAQPTARTWRRSHGELREAWRKYGLCAGS